MIERDDVDALGEFENRLRIVVVANPNVVDHQGRAVTLGRCQHANVDAQGNCGLLCHPCKLTSADDPNRWEVID